MATADDWEQRRGTTGRTKGKKAAKEKRRAATTNKKKPQEKLRMFCIAQARKRMRKEAMHSIGTIQIGADVRERLNAVSAPQRSGPSKTASSLEDYQKSIQ